MEDKHYRILVVDDEADLCEILQFNLEAEGYRTDVAYSAEEALTLDIAAYDLLLLDVMMGEMSGFEMARRVKDNPLTKQTAHHLSDRARHGGRHRGGPQPRR